MSDDEIPVIDVVWPDEIEHVALIVLASGRSEGRKSQLVASWPRLVKASRTTPLYSQATRTFIRVDVWGVAFSFRGMPSFDRIAAYVWPLRARAVVVF